MSVGPALTGPTVILGPPTSTAPVVDVTVVAWAGGVVPWSGEPVTASSGGVVGWAGDPVTATWVTTTVDPDDGLRQDLTPQDVSPGVLGFLVIFLLALACIPLFLSMTSKLRKVNHRGRRSGAGTPDDVEEPTDGTVRDRRGSGGTGTGGTGSDPGSGDRGPSGSGSDGPGPGGPRRPA